MTAATEELLSQAREALKPCPHCGLLHTLKLTTAQELAEEGEDDPEPWAHSDSWAVTCDMSRPNGPGGCGASGGFYPSEAEAIEAWNRRAAIDAHLKQASAQADIAARVQAALSSPACARLREWVAIGPVQRAAVESLAELLAQPSAPSGEPAEPMTRFCPGCGSVGDVPSTYRDCCPDGGKARVIPAELAESCRDLFKLALEGVAAQAAPAPQTDEWRKVVASVALGLDRCATNGPDDTHETAMREASSRLTKLLVNTTQPAPTQAEHAPSGEPLTDEQISTICKAHGYHALTQQGHFDFIAYARAIERAHGITATTAKG